MNTEVRASAPGNLLISGEYIILEEGGLGMAMACGPLARGRAWPGKTHWSVIHAMTGSGIISLNTATDVQNPPLIIKAFRALSEALESRGIRVPVLEIEIDTREFYSRGRKLGFGSSAAATVILSGLMAAMTIEDHRLSHDEIGKMAIDAHRHAQGKRGSGYDIMTSCHGSAGLFTGGENPGWSPVPADHPIHRIKAFSFPGPREVDSRDAVQRYQSWKSRPDSDSADFLKRSQDLVTSLYSSGSEEELIRTINESRLLSAELGDLIGVESWITPPSPFYERTAWKGSGAGNELGLLFLRSVSESEVPGAYSALPLSEQGLRLFRTDGSAILG